MGSDSDRLQAARAAKEKARKVFAKLAHVTGVGITRRDGDVRALLKDNG